MASVFRQCVYVHVGLYTSLCPSIAKLDWGIPPVQWSKWREKPCPPSGALGGKVGSGPVCGLHPDTPLHYVFGTVLVWFTVESTSLGADPLEPTELGSVPVGVHQPESHVHGPGQRRLRGLCGRSEV